MSASITVHLNTSRNDRPFSRKTAPMFSMVCRASASMPPGTSSSVPGLLPSAPERYRTSPTRTAWLKGSFAAFAAGEPRAN
jgi:hypothetical protein